MKIEEMLNKIYLETKNGFEYVKQIPDKSIDMILCDLPYGTTACKWDVIIPFELLWEQYNKVIKDNGCIALFGTEPFSSYLRLSNIKYFKYDLIWNKMKAGLFISAKKRILPKHENISVFYKSPPIYNPQMENKPIKDQRPFRNDAKRSGSLELKMPKRIHSKDYNESLKYPTSILSFSKEMMECNNTKRVHPTQKPVALCEYLIKTYTNEGDIVLDNCIGSGTTAVACKRLNRNFIGMEIYQNYIDISYKRLSETKQGEGICSK